jgi:hypothetical protein
MSSSQKPTGPRGLTLLLALALVLALLQPIPAPTEPQAAASPPDLVGDEAIDPLVASPTRAIHVSLWWNEQVALRDLDLVQEMGFTWIKQVFPWREIESYQHYRYDWWRTDRIVEDANERGLNLIVRLDRQPFWTQADGGAVPLENAPPTDYQLFEDFCFAVANHYRGRIQAYQVWNEPNLSREWGNQPPNAAEYVLLLAHCYRGIKNGDPDAIVISAGLAPTGTDLPVAVPDDRFYREMYEAGAADYFDMLGVNAPGYAVPPQTDPAVVAADPALGGHRWMSFRHVEDIRQIMLEYGDGETQIAILEMGWTTDPIHPDYSWYAVTEQQQAEYLAGAYWYARQNWQPWIGLMTTIYLADPYWTEDDEEYWWAISYPDWPETRTRPAFDALAGLPNWEN